MREAVLEELHQEVRADPRHVGARLRLGQALVEAGQLEEGASQLRLAAQLDPCNPHIALLATRSR